MNVRLHLAKMAPHVLIFLQVTAVSVNEDILETTVKQVRKYVFLLCLSAMVITAVFLSRLQI